MVNDSTGFGGGATAGSLILPALTLGTGLAGRVLTYKALAGDFRTARLPPDPGCPLCGTAPKIHGVRDS